MPLNSDAGEPGEEESPDDMRARLKELSRVDTPQMEGELDRAKRHVASPGAETGSEASKGAGSEVRGPAGGDNAMSGRDEEQQVSARRLQRR